MEPTCPVCEPGVALCAEAWREHRARASLEANLRRAGVREEAFWEHYAAWVAGIKGDYPGVLLDRVAAYAGPGDTVLDIGAGAGLFALPLARSTRGVTAVEPSPAQARQLREAIRRDGVRNVTVIEQRWENVDAGRLGAHDLVIAIHSLQMDDIAAALRKMCRVARRCLLLVHPAGNSLSAVLHQLGIEPGPDHSALQRILSGLGYTPEVEFVDYSCLVPLDLQLDILRFNPGLHVSQGNALRDYVVAHGMTVQRDGGVWLRRSYTDALLSVTCA